MPDTPVGGYWPLRLKHSRRRFAQKPTRPLTKIKATNGRIRAYRFSGSCGFTSQKRCSKGNRVLDCGIISDPLRRDRSKQSYCMVSESSTSHESLQCDDSHCSMRFLKPQL